MGLVFLHYADKRFADAEKALGAVGSGGWRKVAKKAFKQKASSVAKIYKAILPDPVAKDLKDLVADAVLFSVLAEKITALEPPADISTVMDDVTQLLDDFIATEGYVIREPPEGYEPLVDLSQIDFEAIAQKLKGNRKQTEMEKLKALLGKRVEELVRLNHSRMDYLERFQRMIEAYNAGSKNLEQLFEELRAFANDLKEEEQRAMREGLNEEELALFDILLKPAPDLSQKERNGVKKVARALLTVLKEEKLVRDWRLKEPTRADVRRTIGRVLDRLPEAYSSEMYEEKCTVPYRHFYEAYQGAGQSIYSRV